MHYFYQASPGLRHVPALVVLSLVGVGLLGVDAAVVLDVLEGVVHEAAVAAVVAVRRRAVDQVLLRQRHEEAALAEVLALQGARLEQRALINICPDSPKFSPGRYFLWDGFWEKHFYYYCIT